MRRLLFLASIVFVVSATVALGQRALERGSPEANRAIIRSMQGSSAAGREREIKKLAESVLTADKLDEWLLGNRKETIMRIRAAKRGSISARTKGKVYWNNKHKRYQFRTRQDRDETVGRLKADLNNPRLPSLWPPSFTKGQVGRISGDRHWLYKYSLNFDYRVLQIIDNKTALVSARKGLQNTNFFLVSGVVENLQEGQEYSEIPGVFIVDKKRRYWTALGGVSTIPVLRDYNLGPHLEKLKKKSNKTRSP